MELLVHGGAGSRPDDPASHEVGVAAAIEAGRDTGDALEAVVAAVGQLEADPMFNAGLGSVVQSDGQIRTDSGLMTDDGLVGAACGMAGVADAIRVAQLVAEKTPHVLLAGGGAIDLAAAHDVETDRDLWTDRTREQWAASDRPGAGVSEQLAWVRERFGGHDTVGAVATDGGRVATAVSTGGRWGALAGRVGDVPQVGAGFFAADGAAASATGNGEAIARFGLARRVVAAIDDGDDPQTAADRVIRGFEAELGAEAGVIAIADGGRTGRAHNAGWMPTASSGE